MIKITGMIAKINFLILLLFLTACKNDSTTTNPYAALLVGGRTPYSPTIYSIEPKIGNPAFIDPGLLGFIPVSYEPTLVTMKGKNFIPSMTGNTVLFNGIQANVEYATTEELRMKVPSGAMSGALSVANNGGGCTSPDKKTGPNCEGQDFFIDCYAPYKNIYGAETIISTGTSKNVTFTSVDTKAFKSDLLFTDPNTNDISGNKINIYCTTLTRVLLFSQSCEPTEYKVDGTSLVFNPSISVNSRFYTIQYFVTAGKGDCTVRVN